MEKKPAAGLIRHAVVDGKEKYARIAFRRRRTPLYAEDLAAILGSYMGENGVVDVAAMHEDAWKLSNAGQWEQSGMLICALDFIDLFGRIAFAEE